ncbi:MAG TPA: hypothetical protein PKH70_09260 [Syntrophorhabdaceae bacterium]|nr:hypothetical protein [Syntrophorhabdaceae bacterium]
MKEIQKSYTQVCSTTKRCCEKAAGGEKAEDRRQNTEDRSQKSEGWRVGGLAKAKGSRIQGFKGSSGSLGIFFQNLKAKELRGEGLPNQRNQRVD